jgi:DNA-binding sugar fermentation-stimulating protein
LEELIEIKKQNSNKKAYVLFLAKREDIVEIRTFDIIDPKFGELLRKAAKLGIELLAYQIKI